MEAPWVDLGLRMTDLKHPGVTVIARGSSAQYRRTTKLPREIANELGVH